MHTPLAWRYLTHNKRRAFAAAASIAFVIVLIFVQLGLYASIVKSATQVYDRLNFDIVLVSPRYVYMDRAGTFRRGRLYQALTVNGVDSAVPFYTTPTPRWRNPQTRLRYQMQTRAFNLHDRVFLLPELDEKLAAIRSPDTVLIDRRTRPELGSQATGVVTELNRRKIRIAGQYTLGIGFGGLGSIIVSDQNFSRILNGYSLDKVSLGLIKIVPGASPDVVAHSLRRLLPPDVRVLTRAELEDSEQRYWIEVTSTGIIIGTGTIVAFLVGTIVFYQVLATDITNHIPEYATLKALGYKDSHMSLVVLQQAFMLALMGFVPALALALGVYEVIRKTAYLPVSMTLMRIVFVLILAVVMCSLSGLIALRKVKQADPAELF